MNSVTTLMKWPGGKAREIKYIEQMIPRFERYIEPFFGGGAMYFYLRPKNAIINDISSNLISFYSLVKSQDKTFKEYLNEYNNSFQKLLTFCDNNITSLINLYVGLREGQISEDNVKSDLRKIADSISSIIFCNTSTKILLSKSDFAKVLLFFSFDKMIRTVANEEKQKFAENDLKENIITGFTSGYYMYFRDVYNQIALQPNNFPDVAYNIANFYFIREYCYGSMFRYNSKGEFNIPYGGMSYNRKDFKGKIEEIFSNDTKTLFSDTEISCADFADFMESHPLNENDFMFLDPPYDTDFSDYEGKDFTKNDQKRLSDALKNTKAKFILIIKNTEYIYSLYEGAFNILSFDKTYTYNVRSRNERNVEHLIITNLSV